MNDHTKQYLLNAQQKLRERWVYSSPAVNRRGWSYKESENVRVLRVISPQKIVRLIDYLMKEHQE